jgi:pentatricopeptide repeat protein
VLADRAVGLLNLLPQTGGRADTALWNSIIECVAFSGQLTRALQFLEDMSTEGCRPDTRTFVALLTACTTVCSTIPFPVHLLVLLRAASADRDYFCTSLPSRCLVANLSCLARCFVTKNKKVTTFSTKVEQALSISHGL